MVSAMSFERTLSLAASFFGQRARNYARWRARSSEPIGLGVGKEGNPPNRSIAAWAGFEINAQPSARFGCSQRSASASETPLRLA